MIKLFFLISSIYASNLTITPAMLKFIYQPVEDSAVPCTHQLHNAESQDWKVFCGKREYLVHLWVKEFFKADETSFEVLYWVTDRSFKQPLDYGSTSWIHLKGKSALSSLDFSEQVENGLASLNVIVRLP